MIDHLTEHPYEFHLAFQEILSISLANEFLAKDHGMCPYMLFCLFLSGDYASSVNSYIGLDKRLVQSPSVRS